MPRRWWFRPFRGNTPQAASSIGRRIRARCIGARCPPRTGLFDHRLRWRIRGSGYGVVGLAGLMLAGLMLSGVCGCHWATTDTSPHYQQPWTSTPNVMPPAMGPVSAEGPFSLAASPPNPYAESPRPQSAHPRGPDLIRWWQLLQDNELTALIDQATVQNLELAEAYQRIVAARARRGIVNADRLPSLEGNPSYTYLSTGAAGLSLIGTPQGVDSDLYSLGLTTDWEIDLWGRVKKLVQAAEADIGVAAEDYRAVRIALAAEVAREVIRIRAFDEEIMAVAGTIQANHVALSIAKSREQAGISDGLDTLRAERLVETNQALLPPLEANRRNAEIRIATLLGVSPLRLSVGRRPLSRNLPIPKMGETANLVTRRPDIRRANHELTAATARLKAACAERAPQLSISGSVALQSPHLQDMVDPEAHVVQIGPSLSIPLYQGGRLRNNINLARAEERESQMRLRRTVSNAINEVEIAVVQREQSQRQSDRLGIAFSVARKTELLSVDRFQSGSTDFLDVTEATTERLNIERQRILADRNTLLRLVDLYVALGGGW